MPTDYQNNISHKLTCPLSWFMCQQSTASYEKSGVHTPSKLLGRQTALQVGKDSTRKQIKTHYT